MMTTKRFALALALAGSSACALASPNVGVSVQVNQPGLYGRVDIGQAPVPPALVYPQPVVIVPGAVVQRQPIYLHVPPGHQRNWRHHCYRYNACGQPVYFVRDDWYREHYYRPAPRHIAPPPPPPRYERHDRREWHEDHGRGHDHGEGHGRGHDHGRGHGHGHDR